LAKVKIPCSRIYRRPGHAAAIVLGVAVALRVSLALVNLEANDDHLTVIRLIRTTGHLPSKADCGECFQPKLFHGTAAVLLNQMRVAPGRSEIRVVQLLNATFACGILLVAWRFVRGIEISNRAQFFGLSLFALNPKLIGISAQVTNDTFVIFFGVVTLYCADEFIRRGRVGHFAVMTAAAVLGVLSKTNGIVTCCAVAVALVLTTFSRRREAAGRKMAVFAVAFVVVVPLLVALNPLAQCRENWRRYGSPVTLNIAPQARPLLLEKTHAWWPGIRSVADGFLTFRLLNLLREPYITYPPAAYPVHRTSFWSQIYGRAHFVHFDAWPPSWVSHDPAVLWIGRAILLLALIPTVLLLSGIATETARLAKAVMTGASLASLVLTLSWFAFVGFAVLYAYRYRAFTVMKAIFIYPAALSFVHHFAAAFDRVSTTLARHSSRWMKLLEGALTALLALYVLDVAALIIQLW
jgi:hypothetical protein